jgi:hypothetical protein
MNNSQQEFRNAPGDENTYRDKVVINSSLNFNFIKEQLNNQRLHTDSQSCDLRLGPLQRKSEKASKPYRYLPMTKSFSINKSPGKEKSMIVE